MKELSPPGQSTFELTQLPIGYDYLEYQLRKELFLNDAIMAASSNLMVICDHKGRIARYNRACEQLTLYSCGELRGAYIWDAMFATKDTRRARAFFIQAGNPHSTGPRHDQYVSAWVFPDGERRYIKWTLSVFPAQADLDTCAVGIGEDITEQIILEETLRESQAGLNSIMENANGIIYTLSPEGEFMFVSPGWTEILGHDADCVQGQLLEKFVHPDHFSGFRGFLQEITRDGKSQKQVEYLIQHRDGSWRWNSSSGAAVMDKQGRLKCYVGLAVDITERKQAEAALRLSEEKFSKAFRANPDPITLTKMPEGYYVEVNDAWVEATGYQRYEALGFTVMELGIWVTEEDRSNFLRLIEREGSLRSYRTRYCTKPGEIRDFLVSADLIDMGAARYLLCVHTDITEQLRTQEELRLLQERFSMAFNASPSTISISTLEDGRYIDINDSFCQLVGFQREEILGKTSIELGFWVDGEEREQVVRSILHKEAVRDREITFRKKSGELRLGLYSAEQININGQTCLLSIITDITERRQAEDQIRYLSFYDKLTGLYNRAFFEEELRRLDTTRKLPLSIIIGDVNGLKLVNDALGHQQGDGLLKAAAEILLRSCRHEDVVARWGGDEFIVLLPECDSLSAGKVFNRIKQACQYINDLPLQTSMSLGMATKGRPEQNIREVVKEAEDKMYRNKLLESRSARSTFLFSLEKTLWTRSHETREHCQRMQQIARMIGQAVNLPDSEMDNLLLLASLHDIGKIAIPNSILDKSGALSPEEWEVIKKHPETGYRIGLSSPDMAPIAEAILHHHERWDGRGYPLGLRGTDIPLISRIIAIADTYDVMTNGRPYQRSFSPEEVRREIERCAGSQFDPQMVRVIREVLWSGISGQ